MKTRYREQKRWLRKSVLVLQIGRVSKVGPYHDDCPPPSHDENAEILRWYDATVEDLGLQETTQED